MASVVDPEGKELSALAELADVRGLRVLELGAGRGRLTFRYARLPASVLAVDTDEQLITEARADLPPELREKVEFRVADAIGLDEPPESFDLAFFSWSL